MVILLLLLSYCHISTPCLNREIVLPSVQSINDIENALSRLKNPFSKKERIYRTAPLQTDNPFFDKGIFQFVVYEDYLKDPEDERICTYFLYKIAKYALHAGKIIHDQVPLKDKGLERVLSNIIVKDFWNTLYKQLQWYTEENNKQLLTPCGILNYGLQFALLLDVNFSRSFAPYLQDVTGLSTSFFSSIFSINARNKASFLQEALKINREIAPWLSFFKEKKESIDFSSLKYWFGNKDQYIYPFLGQDGIIGVNVITLCHSKRSCPVGIGLIPSLVHNKEYKSIFNAAFHDFLHSELQRKGEIKFFEPSLERLFFFEKLFTTMLDLILQYRNADIEKKVISGKHMLATFTATHELGVDNEPFNGKNNAKNIANKIDNIFESDLYTLEKPSKPAASNDLKKTLFNSLDMYNLFQAIIPDLKHILNKSNLQIKEGELKTSNATPITYGQLHSFTKHLKDIICESWQDFATYYGEKQFKNRLPFSY